MKKRYIRLFFRGMSFSCAAFIAVSIIKEDLFGQLIFMILTGIGSTIGWEND